MGCGNGGSAASCAQASTELPPDPATGTGGGGNKPPRKPPAPSCSNPDDQGSSASGDDETTEQSQRDDGKQIAEKANAQSKVSQIFKTVHDVFKDAPSGNPISEVGIPTNPLLQDTAIVHDLWTGLGMAAIAVALGVKRPYNWAEEASGSRRSPGTRRSPAPTTAFSPPYTSRAVTSRWTASSWSSTRGVGDQVVVLDRVLRSSAQRGDDRVGAALLASA